jgi:hypothetical protein
MMRKTFKCFLPVALIGCFVAGPAAFAQEGIAHAPAANRIDRRALRRQGRRIVRRRHKLRAEVRHFGPRSPQARASRRQLKRSQRRFKRQARDLRRDRRQAFRH